MVASVVVVLFKVVVDFAIVLLVDDGLGLSELDDPHADSKPTLTIDTQKIPAKSFCLLITSRLFRHAKILDEVQAMRGDDTTALEIGGQVE